GAELDTDHLAKLDDLVSYATSRGAHVILNPHNFARYDGKLIGSAEVPASAFADLWARLPAKDATNDRVQVNRFNEPNQIATEQWLADANAAIAAIRAAGAMNVVLVPGNFWTGAHAWTKSHYGTSNAEVMLDIVDPADNYVYEVHQYLDEEASGK